VAAPEHLVLPRAVLHAVFDRLLARYGPRHWWPGETPFEVMVGAVLTQNTAWSNVERAIANLKAAAALDPAAIAKAPRARLAEWLRPSGYFNVKTERLQGFCRWYLAQGGFEGLDALDTPSLRHGLLGVRGIGPETADDIVLYAFARPVFVIDAYTRRIFARLGLIRGDEGYETLRRAFEHALGPDTTLFNEYHALIVAHGKERCRARPRCAGCSLDAWCQWRPQAGAAP
jgi:endonuclease-3 related protein